MSNPLRWFRQNSKILVVFLGIGAMAIFGLGPVFDVLSRSSSYEDEAQNPVIAKWKGGDLKRSDLNSSLRRHYELLRFQQGVQQAAVGQVGEEYRANIAPIQPIRDTGSRAQVDDQLIERKLLAEKAAQEGFVISDSMIDDFLALLAGEAEFSRADLEVINNEVNQRSCSLAQIRLQLKSELLYRQMRVMASGGQPGIPNPTESMELYAKNSNRIECEVMAVPVSQFMEDVTEEPSNSTLRSLYNEGKSRYPDPTGQKPGFKIGRRLVAQYFVADFETFQQNEMNKLTDAQVEAEYDRLVAEESDLVMEVIPQDVEDDVVTPDDVGEEEAPEADGQSINVRKMKQRRVSTRLQETEVDQAVDAVDEVVDAAEKVVDAVTETIQESAVKTPATETPATEAVETVETPMVETDVPVETASEVADEKAETAGDEMKTSEEAKSAPQADAEDKTDETTEEDDSIGPLLTDTPKLEKRAKPLRDVADAIKKQLVAADTNAAIQEAMVEASSQVSNFRGAYMNWKNGMESGSKDAQPEFDFKGVAESLNLLANETPLVDDEALEAEQLGKVMTLINVAARGGQYRPQVVSVANNIFNSFENLDEYEVQEVQDFQTQSRYVYWLSEKQEPTIPAFEDCRDEVVAFSKQRKAYELAQEEAERLAESMKSKRDKKLSDEYPDQAIKTGEFTWFSNRGGSPAISPVIGVSGASDEFMSTAFGLTKLETGISPNAGRDTVYVIQRISDEKPIDEVATDFIENQFFKFKRTPPQVRNTAAWYRQQMTLDWNDQFVDQMDLEYVGY